MEALWLANYKLSDLESLNPSEPSLPICTARILVFNLNSALGSFRNLMNPVDFSSLETCIFKHKHNILPIIGWEGVLYVSD